MRLLLVSFAFPPFNSIGAVRVGKTAKYLSKLGHDLRVLTAKDQPFQPTLPLEIESDHVIYTNWLDIRGPAKIVLQRQTQAAAGNRLPRRGLSATLRETLGGIYRSTAYFPDSNIGWLPFALKASSRLIKSWKPDLILASAPPPTSLLVASKLSQKHGIPWVADLRDLWVDHQYYSQPGWRRLVEEKLENRVLSSAVGLVTVSEPLADTLKRKYGKPAAVVLNGFDPSDYPCYSNAPNNYRYLRILYTGVVYAGKQDPSPLFEALLELGQPENKLKVIFHGFYLGIIREMIAHYKLEKLAEVNDPVPYEESLRMQSEADILLLLLWTDPAERGVYTGKLFEYIGARRPILAIGTAGNVAADMILNKGVGVVMNDPSEIARQLRKWLQQKQQLGSIPRLDEEVGSGMSREEQVKKLEDYLCQVLGQTVEAK
jgi:glycosyltransferase involved in cell wall biosynthesis